MTAHAATKGYDVIIVGARCGGAPLAMLLGRAGHRVLLLERMPFGSDIMSTHYVKRTGASLLARWGLLEAVCSKGTPAISRQTFQLDDFRISGCAPGCDGIAFDVTPRRYVLDEILVQAAIAAGVEARDRFKVTSLLFEDNRVVGVRGIAADGGQFEERASVVVGADGPRSLVASEVGAPFTLDAGTHTCGYYAYFSGMRAADDLASVHVLSEARRFFISFPTNDELDMVFQFWPGREAAHVRRNLHDEFERNLRLVPELEARTTTGRRETPIAGTHLLPNYFRRAHGPGWALVGDAALHRDPITAQGITNAFTHAAILAEELDKALQGLQSIDAATASYDRRQFEVLKPMFDYTVHLATMQPLLPELAARLPVVAADAAAGAAFIGAFLGSVPLSSVFGVEILERFESEVRRLDSERRLAAA